MRSRPAQAARRRRQSGIANLRGSPRLGAFLPLCPYNARGGPAVRARHCSPRNQPERHAPVPTDPNHESRPSATPVSSLKQGYCVAAGARGVRSRGAGETVEGVKRTARRTDAACAAVLALEIVGSLMIWAPIPVAWIWVGARVYDATGSFA